MADYNLTCVPVVDEHEQMLRSLCVISKRCWERCSPRLASTASVAWQGLSRPKRSSPGLIA